MNRRTASFIGRDGAITLVAAMAAVVLTAGIAPVAATVAVVRRAWRAQRDRTGGSTRCPEPPDG